ncbi:Gfo/Idh/MocA family oxidoreductase [Candidatus Bathyarchaeota archaeon]|nr:Gfo/Idh/MocA family oxidoreductase [Candidatus Bathyarchaeota archaeon]
MDKQKLRVGVVGLGKMGLLHASILNVIPDVQLVAICEKNSFTRKLLEKIIRRVPIVGDVTDFSGLDLDAVYVTTPIPSHFSVAKLVCQERLARNLFVEKPLTATHSESKEICTLAKQTCNVTMVGYLRRFMVTFLKAKELLSENAIGELESFTISAFSSDFCGINDNPQVSIARGGVLKDLGSYAIDLALWFFGDVKIDSAMVESLTGEGAEDSVNFTVHRKSGGLKGDFSVSWCAEGYRMPEVALSISGSKGLIEVNDDKVSFKNSTGEVTTWYRPDLNDDVSFWLGNPEYFRESAYFVNSVQKNLAAEPSFETAAKVDFMIEAIQRRARHLG